MNKNHLFHILHLRYLENRQIFIQEKHFKYKRQSTIVNMNIRSKKLKFSILYYYNVYFM